MKLDALRETICSQGMLRLALLFLGLIILYFPVLKELATVWSVNDNFSHGYFIPLISVYMIYSLRGELQKESLQPVNWGGLLILLGLALLLAASFASTFFVQRFSLLLVLWGLSLFLFGAGYGKKLFFPIAYLIFMIPIPAIIWNKIAFPMQLFSSGLTENIISQFGIPVYREGNVLVLAQTTLEVVDACSGLRSLTTMFALSAALAWFARCPLWRKWVLFLSAVPIAISVNIVRLTATAMLASRYGEKVAQGFLHEFSGMLAFGLGLLLLWVAYALLAGEKK